MQYLKEEIRRKILENALEEFKKEGYRRSSLRRIAGKTGISAGNIYRYFQSKEELLLAIMNPIQQEIDQLVIKNEGDINHIMEVMIRIFVNYPRETEIIMGEELGRIAKDMLVDIVVKKLIEKQLHDADYARILASSFIEGLFLIIKSFKNDRDRMAEYLEGLIDLFFQREKAGPEQTQEQPA